MDPKTRKLVETLVAGEVNFIIIGGWAAIFNGSPRLTFDFDVVYERTKSNIARLAATLAPIHPYLRGAPPGLPFCFDDKTIRAGLNFTLVTDFGDLDVLGEIVGGGTYTDLLPHTFEVSVSGLKCRCLNLETLIKVKRATGRTKDLLVLSELQALLDLQQKPPSP